MQAITHEIGSMFYTKYLSGIDSWQPKSDTNNDIGIRAHNFGEMINEALGRDPKFLPGYGSNNPDSKFYAGFGVDPTIWGAIMALLP